MTPPTHPLQTGSFDPLAMLRRNRGDGGDVRTIKLRMLWLRQQVPEARVTTTMVTLDANVVVMSATIALPDGGEGAGHAASQISEGADLAELIETTELRAIGRALDILGYVVTDQPETPPPPERAKPDTEPSEQEPAESAQEPPQRPAGEERVESEPVPETSAQGQSNAPDHVQALRSLRNRSTRPSSPPTNIGTGQRSERQAPAGRSTPSPTASNPPQERRPPTPIKPSPEGEPALEDISWTAFWDWARSTYQFTSRVQLEELLGQSIAQKSPGEVRQLILEHLDGDNSPES